MKQKKAFKYSALCLSAVMAALLNACASTGLVTPQEPASLALLEEREQSVRKLKAWKLSAEVHITQGNRAGRVRLTWIENKGRFKIRIAAIAGVTLAVIKGRTGGAVSAIDSEGMEYYANDIRKLVKDILQIDIPADYLRFWVLGSPAPEVAVSDARQSEDEISSFTQDGWEVAYYYHKSTDQKQARVKQISMRSGEVLVIANIRSLRTRT